MEQEDRNLQSSRKLRDRIRTRWTKLTDDEIAYKTINPPKFFEAVESKYGLAKDRVEEQVRGWEKEFSSAA